MSFSQLINIVNKKSSGVKIVVNSAMITHQMWSDLNLAHRHNLIKWIPQKHIVTLNTLSNHSRYRVEKVSEPLNQEHVDPPLAVQSSPNVFCFCLYNYWPIHLTNLFNVSILLGCLDGTALFSLSQHLNWLKFEVRTENTDFLLFAAPNLSKDWSHEQCLETELNEWMFLDSSDFLLVVFSWTSFLFSVFLVVFFFCCYTCALTFQDCLAFRVILAWCSLLMRVAIVHNFLHLLTEYLT